VDFPRYRLQRVAFRDIRRRCRARQQSRVDGHEEGLSPTLICVTRLGSALSVMTVSAWWWCLNVYADVPPLPPARARFQTVGHPSCPPLCCFPVAIRAFLPVPMCLSEFIRLVSRAGRRFLPPSRRGSYPEVAWLPTVSARWSSVVFWCGGGWASVRGPCPRFLECGGRPSRYIRCLQLEGLIEGLT
jgi:hypothetical protein